MTKPFPRQEILAQLRKANPGIDKAIVKGGSGGKPGGGNDFSGGLFPKIEDRPMAS